MTVLDSNKVFSLEEEALIRIIKERAKEVAKEIVGRFHFIKPDFAQRINNGNIIIAGGCFTSWFRHYLPRDIDVFLLDDHDTKMAFDLYSEYVINSVRNSIASPDKDKSDYIRTNKKITKVVEEHDQRTLKKYQYIHTDYKTRKELLDHFDFVHATVSYNVGEDKLYITRDAFDCIRDKQLKQNNGNKPEDWRIEKFVSRGWKSLDNIAYVATPVITNPKLLKDLHNSYKSYHPGE